MLKHIKKLFGFGPKEEATQPEAAPYKVEVAPTPVAEQATQAVVESIAPAKKPAKKTAAKKAPAAKKPRAPKTPK
jgi:hypothetical protein